MLIRAAFLLLGSFVVATTSVAASPLAASRVLPTFVTDDIHTVQHRHHHGRRHHHHHHRHHHHRRFYAPYAYGAPVYDGPIVVPYGGWGYGGLGYGGWGHGGWGHHHHHHGHHHH